MILGLSSYTFGWAVGVSGHDPGAARLDENGLLDLVHHHGLKLLQIGDNLPLDTFSEDRLQALADRARREGIRLEVGARKLTTERVTRYAEIARILRATLLRFVIDDRDYHPSIDSVVSVLRASAPALTGLRLGLENHDRLQACEFRSIVDAVGASNVGICLDTANSLGAGEGLDTVISQLAPVTLNLHLKDFQVRRLPHLMGFTVTGAPAGQGLVDIAGTVRALELTGRCPTAILELWTPPEADLQSTLAKELDWAHQSLQFLRPLFL